MDFAGLLKLILDYLETNADAWKKKYGIDFIDEDNQDAILCFA